MVSKTLFNAEGLDDRSLDFLAAAVEKNNLPGFDYYEFKRAVSSLLSSMSMDEATAFKSAFTTASTLGLTKEKLLETARYYRNIVEKEKEQFAQALEGQNKTKVLAKQDEVKRLRDQVERHKAEIARLQNEVGAYLNQIEQGDAEALREGEKLNKAKSNFESTHQAVLLQMDRDVENIHKYL